MVVNRFRWVQCQLDVLVSCRTPQSVRNALANLPKGLFETYERILDSIQTEGEDAERIAKCVLTWIMGTKRPIGLKQLAEAITLQNGRFQLDNDSALFDSQEILEICGGLVTHTETSDLVVLSHFTVQVGVLC